MHFPRRALPLSRLLLAALAVAAALPSQAATVPATVHPGWKLFDLRPAGFEPQVSGMVFQSDGKLVLADWNSKRGLSNHDANQVAPRAYTSRLYVLSGVTGNTPSVTVDTIATGLEDVMGLTLVNDTIFVSGGNAVLRLIRAGGLTGPVTRRDTVFFLPGTPVNGDSLNPNRGLQEYMFGLLYRNGKFYAVASSLDPSTANTQQINPYRGTLLEITPGNGTSDKRGSYRILEQGLREPSGMAFGPDGSICASDNQGEWLPSSKLNCFPIDKPIRYYGARKSSGANNYYAFWDSLTETPPTVWVPQNDIGNSPTMPAFLPDFTPYGGQAFLGDVRWGTGLNRYFLEKNSAGEWQGAVFSFTGGLEAGAFRQIWGPDSMLYIGMIGGKDDVDGYPKNQSTNNRRDFGLQKLRFDGKDTTFEMRAIRSRPTGFEIEFTQPVDTTVALSAGSYTIQSAYMAPSSGYGAGSMSGSVTLTPGVILLSPDRRTVFLTLVGLVPSIPTQMRVVYFKLNNFRSASGAAPWTTESWYTLNALGTGTPFDIPVALRSPALGNGAAPAALNWKISDRLITVRTDIAGPWSLTLRDPRGVLLSRTQGDGPGERVLTLPASGPSLGILEIQSRSVFERRAILLH